MAEYIEKDVVLDLVDEYACENKIYLADLYKCISDMIKEIVDPVVHCKDCRYRLDCSMNNFYYCSWHKSFIELNAFCSYGINKLEDQVENSRRMNKKMKTKKEKRNSEMIKTCDHLEVKVDDLCYEMYDLYCQILKYSSESKRILSISSFERMQESMNGMEVARQFLCDFKKDLTGEVECDEKLSNVLRCDC